MTVNLDPEPWCDPRPGTSLDRGELPWGHAQFLPRLGYSQDALDYIDQFARAECLEDPRP